MNLQRVVLTVVPKGRPRKWPHRRGLALATLVGLSGLAACKGQPDLSKSTPTNAATPAPFGQALLRCDDGTSVEVDLLDQGLRMAVTWLPRGPTEQLNALNAGGTFVGKRTRATIVGSTTAFQVAGGHIRICHRQSR